MSEETILCGIAGLLLAVLAGAVWARVRDRGPGRKMDRSEWPPVPEREFWRRLRAAERRRRRA